MKFIIIILSLLSLNGLLGQTAKVQAIARSLEDKVLLRWAVDQPYEWQQANSYGFLVERVTISRNGEAVLPMERRMLTPEPLKPRPLSEWEDLATKNQNAAVVAQALYGDSFEVDVPGSAKGQIMAINKELEQRFTFALVAVDQSYETAKLAGWALEDTTVSKGDSYLYKISVAIPKESDLVIQEGAVDASPDNYRPLPKPVGLVAVFNDKVALLNWDFGSLRDVYTSYLVERSEDKINFKRLNGQPIFKADRENEQAVPSIFYSDSIVNNKKYYYRVRGISSFGETGPPSEAIEGMGSDAIKYTPRIVRKEIPDDNTVVLFWDFPEEANELITGFELRRSNKVDGPFETVLANLPPTARKATYNNLKRINYFTVAAKVKDRTDAVSYATIVQPVDSIPPAPPKELTGIADTTGIVRLTWNKNSEDDLAGYRIFRSNNPSVEFSEITRSDWEANEYSDTLNLGLNEKVFYKVRAMDQRYNASDFSDVVEVELPNTVPPSPPVIQHYSVQNDSIEIRWIASSSPDVGAHEVYRKNLESEGSSWELIGDVLPEKEQVFVDDKEKARGVYSYTVLAKSKSGLESKPSEPITVNYLGNNLSKEITKFNGISNRELRFISLTWRVKNMKVAEFLLYRAVKGTNLKLYKTLGGSVTNYSDYELEINSEYIYGIKAITEFGEESPMKKIEVSY